MSHQAEVSAQLIVYIEAALGAGTIVEEPESIAQLAPDTGTLFVEDYDPVGLDYRQELSTYTYILLFKRQTSVDETLAGRERMTDDLEAIRDAIRVDEGDLGGTVWAARVSDSNVQSLKGSNEIIGLVRIEVEVMF